MALSAKSEPLGSSCQPAHVGTSFLSVLREDSLVSGQGRRGWNACPEAHLWQVSQGQWEWGWTLGRHPRLTPGAARESGALQGVCTALRAGRSWRRFVGVVGTHIALAQPSPVPGG